jgi:hypothetical protein
VDIQPRETLLTDFEDTLGEIYVERQTSLLYEVKFFDGFVLVRPASPAFYLALRKLSHNEFADMFDEFYGDHEDVREAIRGMTPDIVIER